MVGFGFFSQTNRADSEVSNVSEVPEAINFPDLTYEDDEDLYRRVFGHVDQQEDVLLDMDVLIDGEKVGQAPVLVGKESKIQVATLKELLEDFLDAKEINLIKKDSDGFIKFEKLNRLSIKIRLNKLKMQVEISLPAEKKKIRSLGYHYGKTKIKPNATPAYISGFMNVRAAQTFYQSNHSYNTKDLVLTPAVNLFGLCAEGEVSYKQSSDAKEKSKFRRDYTTFVYDWAEPDVMFRYGDVFSHSLSYQSAPHVWGFNIYKDVEREKSEGINSPIQITLLRTSTIEVYSNNNLIKTRTNVAPGTYTLDDISYRNGANDIKIKIIDDTGREQILDESCFYESSFVPQGKFTFNGTYGYPEINDQEKGRYDKKNPVISTSLKYGLLSSTEIGLGFLKNKIGNTKSSEIRNRNILGQFDFKYAQSKYQENGKSISGKVYYVRYSTPSIELFEKTSLGFSVSREQSDNFFKPYLGLGSSELKFEDDVFKKEENLKGKTTTTTYGVSLNNLFTLNFSYDHSRKKTSDNKNSKRDYVNISRSFTINNDWISSCGVSANFGRSVDSDRNPNRFFGVYLSVSMRNNVSISSGYSRTDDDKNKYISISQYPEKDGFGYGITASESSSQKGASLYTNYSNYLLRGNLNHSRNNLGSRTTNIGLESAIYFADGNFAISKAGYSDGGFVIVTPKKALTNRKIKFLDKDAESGFFGGAVLQNSRTSVSSSRVDLRDLPDNINLKQDTIQCYGEYKRGFVAEISAEESITAQGILLDSNGKPFEQITGYVLNKNNTDEKPISFFTNSEGEFLLMDLKPGKYKLVLNVEGIEDLEIEIKEGNGNEILDLGKIICKDSI